MKARDAPSGRLPSAFELAHAQPMLYKGEYECFPLSAMRAAILLLLTTSLLPAQTEVSACLLGMRSDYRARQTGEKDAFSFTIGCTPAPGLALCASPELTRRLRITDASGQKLEAAATETHPTREGDHTQAVDISLLSQPKGEWLDIEGELSVRIATQPLELPRFELNLTEPARLSLAGKTFTAYPEPENGEKANLERGIMKEAIVTLQYSQDVTILQIARIWEGETDDGRKRSYLQQLDAETDESADGTRTTRLHLWDAHPKESFLITTCESVRTVRVPIHFRLRLGEVDELPAAPPPQP